MIRVSVVVPVYYNAPSLPELYTRLNAIARSNPDWEFEYVFVDDGSGDNSFQVLQDLARQDNRVRVIRLARNFGAISAVMAGLHYATGDCVAIIAADLQDPPELIPQLVEQWKQGNKVVLAIRQRRHDPFTTRFFANVFAWLFRRLVFSEYPPQGFDFVLIDRRVVQTVVECREKNTNLMALILWLGHKRALVYYTRQERPYGHSRWTFAKKLKYFADSFVGFSYLPVRAASLFGFVFAILGFIYAFVIIVNKLFRGIDIEGWSSLMVVVLMAAGIQLVMIGILGEYVWRNLDETRRRPIFLIEEMLGFDTTSQVVGQ